MKFSESHEWVDVGENQIATIGITNFAQKELGEIVYVELPETSKTVKAGTEAAVLESTKAAADVYSPISGTIVEVNKALSNTPELVNRSPEKEGWIFKVKLTNASELDALLDEKAYRKKIT